MPRLAPLPTAKPLRLHAEGRTLLSASGRYAATGGRGDVRGPVVLSSIETDGAFSTVYSVEEGAEGGDASSTALAVDKTAELIAIAEPMGNNVGLFRVPSCDIVRLAYRAETKVYALAFNHDSSLLAVGEDNGTITIASVAETEDVPAQMKSRSASVKSLAWDPRGQYLAAAYIDGSVTIFDANTQQVAAHLGHMKAGDTQSSDYSNIEFPLAWHPSGDVLAVGVEDGTAVVGRGSFQTLHKLVNPSPYATAVRTMTQHTGALGLAWSPNGRYLAEVDIRRLLTVYDATVVVTADADAAASASTGGAKAGAATLGAPAVALHAYIKEFDPSAAGEVPADDTAALAASPITAIQWPAGGSTGSTPTADLLLVADATGFAASVKVRSVTDRGSAVAALTEAVQWPLRLAPVPTAAPTTAAAAAAAAAAAVLPSKSKDKAKAAKPAVDHRSAAVKALLDNEASEGSDEEDTVEEDEDSQRQSPSRTPAAGRKRSAGEEADKDTSSPTDTYRTPSTSATGESAVGELDVSMSNLKRKHGFGDVDPLDADGEAELLPGSGLKRLEEGEGEDDDYDDEDGAGRRRGGGGGSSGGRMSVRELVHHRFQTARYVRDTYGLVAPQPAFQSGATRYRDSGSGKVRKRYLAWNAVGAVVSRIDATQTTVDVDFVDSSLHRGIHEDDAHGYSLAALTESGLLLASRYRPPEAASIDEQRTAAPGQAAVIEFRAFNSYGPPGSSNWRIPLPVFKPHAPAHLFDVAEATVPEEGQEDAEPEPEAPLDTAAAAESPLAVGLGDGWAVVATDQELLRFIRTGGVQEAVVAIPGAPVTVAAHGALAAVVYHRGMPSGYRQHLSVDLYLYRGLTSAKSVTGVGAGSAAPHKVCTVDLPMRPHALLQWLAFSSNGVLMAHDSLGMLYGLQMGYNAVWAPVCDTKLIALTGGVQPSEAIPASTKEKSKELIGSGGSGGSGGKSDDFMWPVAVTMTPPSVLTTAGAGATAATSLIPSALVPTLFAVLVKGGQKEPAVLSPRPLAAPIALQVPLAELKQAAAVDNAYILAEQQRLHRAWLAAAGLATEATPGAPAAASLALSVALSAAAAAARGEENRDPEKEVAIARMKAKKADTQDIVAADKAVMRRIQEAVDSQRDVQAVHLAARLHSGKSFEVAAKIAQAAGRAAVAERIIHMGMALPLETAGAGEAAIAAAATVVAQAALAAAANPPPPAPAAASAAAAREKDAPRFGLAAAASDYDERGPAAKRVMTAVDAQGARGLPSAGASGPGARGSSSGSGAGAGSSGGFNPFQKRAPSSPGKRKREGGEGLEFLASPSRSGLNSGAGSGGAGSGGGGVGLLNRQSSLAMEARDQRRMNLVR